MKDQIAERIIAGDEKAFELLFRKHYERLCCFANKFLNDPEGAKDVVQEVFVKLWDGREDIDSEKSLESYHLKITKNICINKLRRIHVESKYVMISGR